MFDDASRAFTQCGRFDLLNKLYQIQNMWSEAIHIAETKDRIHLKNTYFRCGKHLSLWGQTEEAIAAFEKAGSCE